jgi:hypothetical protein
MLLRRRPPSVLEAVDPVSPFSDRLQRLVTLLNQALYHTGYRPNCDAGVRMQPEWQAFRSTLVANFLKMYA